MLKEKKKKKTLSKRNDNRLSLKMQIRHNNRLANDRHK